MRNTHSQIKSFSVFLFPPQNQSMKEEIIKSSKKAKRTQNTKRECNFKEIYNNFTTILFHFFPSDFRFSRCQLMGCVPSHLFKLKLKVMLKHLSLTFILITLLYYMDGWLDFVMGWVYVYKMRWGWLENQMNIPYGNNSFSEETLFLVFFLFFICSSSRTFSLEKR